MNDIRDDETSSDYETEWVSRGSDKKQKQLHQHHNIGKRQETNLISKSPVDMTKRKLNFTSLKNNNCIQFDEDDTPFFYASSPLDDLIRPVKVATDFTALTK